MRAPDLPSPLRNLVLVLGDQLNRDSAAFDGFDPDRDGVWMAENQKEATHVWCHKQRLVLFFSAMRHFRDERIGEGLPVRYHELTAEPDRDRGSSFAEILDQDLRSLQPRRLIVVTPGDQRVAKQLRKPAHEHGVDLDIRVDRHFYTTPEEFTAFAEGRNSLLMETFYREQRRRFGILLDPDGKPEGGDWNYDADNRQTFGRSGPEHLPKIPSYPPDALTRGVMNMVEARFGDHPGRLDTFDWPVTARDAASALGNFIQYRLPDFGTYEDAIWTGEHGLYHSRLSAALNLKLLDPRQCVDAAVAAYRRGDAPLNSVEGFVRQILGWREFIRGIYTLKMPEYAELNALKTEDRDVPRFFWDGETDMVCAADAMDAVLRHGWSHHIQRLMVLGQFSLLLGVHPYRFHEWHMAMYVDAIDWVSLPNTLGMSQYGDGGIVGTKPYCASGNYIHKMSNACSSCRYQPSKAEGEDACPFTTLYWDFLARHRERFSDNRRMTFQIKNLERKSPEQLTRIRKQAEEIRASLDSGHTL